MIFFLQFHFRFHAFYPISFSVFNGCVFHAVGGQSEDINCQSGRRLKICLKILLQVILIRPSLTGWVLKSFDVSELDSTYLNQFNLSLVVIVIIQYRKIRNHIFKVLKTVTGAKNNQIIFIVQSQTTTNHIHTVSTITVTTFSWHFWVFGYKLFTTWLAGQQVNPCRQFQQVKVRFQQ